MRPLKTHSLLFFFLALAFIPRGIALLTPSLWRDECTVGIMGLRVLQGEFPVFLYGQAFMGALEAFFYAPLFLLFSPLPLVMEVFPVFLSLVFILTVFLLMKKIWGNLSGYLGIGYLVLPNFYLLGWTNEARPHYSLTPLFGNILFLITLQIARYPSPGRPLVLFGLLGFLAGLGWWTNYLFSLYLLSAGLYLFYLDPKFIFSRSLGIFLGMFVVGSLPLWLFNFHEGFTLLPTAPLSLRALGSKVSALFLNAFPILLGFDPVRFRVDPLESWGSLFLGGIMLAGMVLFLLALWTARKGPAGKGAVLFLLLFLITTGLNLVTEYGLISLSSDDPRYLLPLYSCFPVFLGTLFLRFWSGSRSLVFLLALPFFFFHLIGNVKHPAYVFFNGWTVFDSVNLRAHRDTQVRDQALQTYLLDKGLTRLYARESLGKKITLLSGEKIIVSEHYQENYLPYAWMVDGAARVAYLIEGGEPIFERNLRALGGVFKREQTPGVLQLYYDFQAPRKGSPLPRADWEAYGNPCPEDAGRAFDGDIRTGWSVEQRQGAWFMLDLGRETEFSGISWIPDNYREIPSGYGLSVSKDGHNWIGVIRVEKYLGPFFWSGSKPMIKIRHGRVEANFSAVSGRYLRLHLEGEDPSRRWSINELQVYAPGGETAPVEGKGGASLVRLARFLEGNNLTLVLADHELSAALRLHSPIIVTSPSNHFVGNQGQIKPLPQLFPQVPFLPTLAMVVEGEGGPLEKQLKELGWNYRVQVLGPYRVYFRFLGPPSGLRPISPYRWQGHSNRNSGQAAKAFDRIRSSRWSTGEPQRAGTFFQLDLNGIRRVQGFTLDLNNALEDYPRRLSLSGSRDGLAFQEIPAAPLSYFYFSGLDLIKAGFGKEKITYRFPPREIRFLRLTQNGNSPTYFWSIHELEVYE